MRLRVDVAPPAAARLLALRRHEHELDHARRDLGVGHVLRVDDAAPVGRWGGRDAKVDLLEVRVEAPDDVGAVLGDRARARLAAREGEEALVELAPERHTPVRNLVDRLPELAADGEDAAGDAAVARLPARLVRLCEAGRRDDEALDLGRRRRLCGDHQARREQHGVAGHGDGREAARRRPRAVQPRPRGRRGADARACRAQGGGWRVCYK